jgi:catechol 2,3-dioxygenase-like lactoylglutathione lyase family enzyme
MLTYITIGTNDLQRAAAFYDAIFNVLGYSRLPAWTRTGQCGEMKNPDEGFSFCIWPPFDGQPATAETGQCSHSVQLTRSLSDVSMQQAFLRDGRE